MGIVGKEGFAESLPKKYHGMHAAIVVAQKKVTRLGDMVDTAVYVKGVGIVEWQRIYKGHPNVTSLYRVLSEKN